MDFIKTFSLLDIPELDVVRARLPSFCPARSYVVGREGGENVAFVGIDRYNFAVTWLRHWTATKEGRGYGRAVLDEVIRVHIMTPFVLMTVKDENIKSYNIARSRGFKVVFYNDGLYLMGKSIYAKERIECGYKESGKIEADDVGKDFYSFLFGQGTD